MKDPTVMGSIGQKISSKVLSDRRLVHYIKSAMKIVGYDRTHWVRVIAYEECLKKLESLGLKNLDILEISAGSFWHQFEFASYSEMNYPDYDICKDVLDRDFDVIIADNIFEHLLWPRRAAKNVFSMLRPGGVFLNITPFLIRRHEVPVDCSRWTETGIKYLLAEGGFNIDSIETGSWGNRRCVKANLARWAMRGWFGSLRNEPDFPVTVWAFASKDA